MVEDLDSAITVYLEPRTGEKLDRERGEGEGRRELGEA